MQDLGRVPVVRLRNNRFIMNMTHFMQESSEMVPDKSKMTSKTLICSFIY